MAARLVGTQCALCGDPLLRGPNDPETCAGCAGSREDA